MRLFSRNQPPAAVAAQLARDDRVVAWAPTVDGATLVATRFGLLWPFSDGARLINWERIDKATWRDAVVTVVEADLIDDLLLVDRAPISVELADPRDLPPIIRQRVQSGVVSSELVSGGDIAFRVVGRRVPGRDGVSWWARLEPGIADTDYSRSVVHDVVDSRRAQQAELERQ